MPETATQKPTELTDVERQEICQLYKDGTPVKDIVVAYRLSGSAKVSQIAKRAGIPLRRPITVTKKPRLSADEELHELEQQRVELEKKIQAARDRKALQAIRFELLEYPDETVVIIHGVTDTFVAHEGMAKLRAWIENHIPQRRAPNS